MLSGGDEKPQAKGPSGVYIQFNERLQKEICFRYTFVVAKLVWTEVDVNSDSESQSKVVWKLSESQQKVTGL